MKRTTFILALIAALSACNEVVAVTPEVSMEAAVSDRLFMGRGLPSGGSVTDQQWKDFLDTVVTPRFPDGLTVFRAEGQWRDPAGGTIKAEQTFVLEIVHSGSAAAMRSMEEIA